MTEEDEFRARYAEEVEFARRYKEELAFERRHTRETLKELRKGQKAIVDVASKVIENAMAVKPAAPVIAPVVAPAKATEVKDWTDDIETLHDLVDDLYALGRGKGGPMPFDKSSPGIVTASGGGTVNFLRADNTWQPVATGDPWTYVKLAADVTTNSQAPVNAIGLAFTPLANAEYIVEGMLLIQSAATYSGVQPGISWPSGLVEGAARIETSDSSTTTVIVNLPAGTNGSAAATQEPAATTSYPATITATMLTGASPSGQFQITFNRS